MPKRKGKIPPSTMEEAIAKQEALMPPQHAKAGDEFSATVSTSAVILASGTVSAKMDAIIARVAEPLPAEHPAYAMIGRVTSERSHLEHALDVIIWELAQIRADIGSCITGQVVGHWPRFNAILALGTLRNLSSDLLADILDLQRTTTEVAKDRNRIIHDAWYTGSPGTVAAQYRSVAPWNKKKQAIFGLEDIAPEYINELISRIGRRREAVAKLHKRITDALDTSR